MAKIVELIETDDLRGEGVEGSPYRRVTQYFTKEGELLFEIDPQSNKTKGSFEGYGRWNHENHTNSKE